MGFILQWIDVLWLPAGLAVVHKQQRFYAAGFFTGSMIMMRLLAELMESIGFPNGMIGLLHGAVSLRGLIVYSLSYLFYILFLYARPQTPPALLLAGSISVFFITAVLFTIIMVL